MFSDGGFGEALLTLAPVAVIVIIATVIRESKKRGVRHDSQ